MPLSVSLIILTKNEEVNIMDCLENTRMFAEVIVIDDNSIDRTVEVARRFNSNIKIYKRNLSDDFSKQRNFGLSKANNEWVLFVDADERLSDALVKEIGRVIKANKNEGFYIRRRDLLWGRELKHGEVGNVSLLRLGKKDKGRWIGKVHEVWEIKGRIGKLNNEIAHFPHQTIKEFLTEINKYSTIRAEELKESGIKAKLSDIVLYPTLKFVLNYFLKLGVLDGNPGLMIALMMSFHSFLVRAKLWQLTKRGKF